MMVPDSRSERLKYVLDMAWEVFIKRTDKGRLRINQEVSMQLHYAHLIQGFGELMCLRSDDNFYIELEHRYNRHTMDIICAYGRDQATVKLKLIRKSSSHALDMEMYEVLKDISRLQSYEDFGVKKFICMTDNPTYLEKTHTRKLESISIAQGKVYKAKEPIVPWWAGQKKDKSRYAFCLKYDLNCDWHQLGGWYYLTVDFP